MTNSEYVALYKRARRRFGIITKETMLDIKSVYIKAGELVAQAVINAEISGKSELTIKQFRSIEKQLQNGAEIISKSVEENTKIAIRRSYKEYYSIDSKYIMDSVKDAGDLATELIKPVSLSSFGTQISESLIRDLVTRQNQAGYTFVESIWNTFDADGLPIGISGDYQYRIKNLIQTGVAQGRDGVKIGGDIMEYIRNGSDAVFKPGRYGKLIPGTAEYKARIPNSVDWRALRLVRSELYMSLQGASIEQAKFNPGCSGLVNWILTEGSIHKCICPELAKASPYKINKVPVFPHPNCFCTITPVLRDHDEFINDLKDFVNDRREVPYLRDWIAKIAA